jgi:hypothetical protein
MRQLQRAQSEQAQHQAKLQQLAAMLKDAEAELAAAAAAAAVAETGAQQSCEQVCCVLSVSFGGRPAPGQIQSVELVSASVWMLDSASDVI